ncbi:825_t:CDS:2, partial [Entrophospora sp. SA101]
MHQYFDHKLSKWNIEDVLKENNKSEVKDWVLNCESEKSPSISIQNTFTGGTLTIGTDNEVSTRQIKSKLHNMESGEMTPDY